MITWAYVYLIVNQVQIPWGIILWANLVDLAIAYMIFNRRH